MGTIEHQGFSAYYPGGAPHLICPYPTGSDDREVWIAGWCKAADAQVVNPDAPVDAAMRKLRMAGPGTEMAYAVKELIEAMLEARQ